MKNIKIAPALAALCTLPVMAQAEINTTASAYVGYTSDSYSGDGALGVLSLDFDGSHALGETVKLTFKGSLDIRSDLGDLPDMRGDAYEVEVGLDFGKGGKFVVSTLPRCNAIENPWIDGRIESRGSVGLHTGVPPHFRCIGGAFPILKNGFNVADTDVYLKYENRFGPVSLELYGDPFRSYNGYSGDDSETAFDFNPLTFSGDDAPRVEAILTYATKPAILSVGGNDLGDWMARAIVPVPSANMAFIYEHQYTNIQTNQHANILVVDWRPQHTGILKGVNLFNHRDEVYENSILSVYFGGADWTLDLGADWDGDVGFEATYMINDSLELLVSRDNGFGPGDGMGFHNFPPETVASRGGAFELGLRMTF